MPSNDRIIKAVGDGYKPIALVVGRAPFKSLDVILDVQFSVVKDKILTLLSTKEVLDISLDISIQGRFASLDKGRHPSALKTSFLIYRWAPKDRPYVFTLNRNSGYCKEHSVISQ